MFDQANIGAQELMQIGFLHAPVAMLVLSNRRIVVANREAERTFGWPAEDLEGQSVRILYPSNVDFEKIGMRWERYLEKNVSHEDERFMQRRDGEVIWVRAKGTTLTPDQPFGLTVWVLEPVRDHLPVATILSARERDVARGIINGHTSKEIGLSLGISPRTVEVHRRSIKRKLGVHRPAELAAKLLSASSPTSRE